MRVEVGVGEPWSPQFSKSSQGPRGNVKELSGLTAQRDCGWAENALDGRHLPIRVHRQSMDVSSGCQCHTHKPGGGSHSQLRPVEGAQRLGSRKLSEVLDSSPRL